MKRRAIHGLAEPAGRRLRAVCGEDRRDHCDAARPGREHLPDVGGVYPSDGEHRRIQGLDDLRELADTARRQPRLRGSGVDVTEGDVVRPRLHRFARLLQAVHGDPEQHGGWDYGSRRFGRQALAREVHPVGASG